MNVKMQTFENSNKENTNYKQLPHLTTNFSKEKANIGSEIRRKLKIKPNNSDVSPAPVADPHNFVASSAKAPPLGPSVQRAPLMQRSLLVDRSTSRSVKSVRFGQKNDDPKLSRKHSTSSILKSSKVAKKPRFSDKMSMNNSICSNIMKDDQSNESTSLNKVTKQKYERLLQSLGRSGKQHTDEMFPQIWSSICRMPDPKYKQLRWARLSELYAGKQVSVWDTPSSLRVLPGAYSKNSMLATCLNTIKHSKFLLEKVLESQHFSQEGIYYLKICQHGTWKYLIIDDYVPVYTVDGRDEPAFLRVESDDPAKVDIWPFLLQKAYAKYYSNYECLDLGNELDFLQELTGCCPEQLNTSSHMERLLHQANSFDSMLIAKSFNSRYYPLILRENAMTSEDPHNSFLAQTWSDQNFRQNFPKVYCISLHKFYYSGFCTIKHTGSAVGEHQISLRTIKLEEPSQCVLSLVQKDAKHLYLSDYRYSWVRMVVVMRESEHNYRWMGGVYQCAKYANLSLWLEPAEYIVLVMPEWRGKGYDLNLTFQGNIKANIDRKPYAGNEHILIEGAMDLAQSKGRLKQLNQNICTYSYIDRSLGLIIENINNERPVGVVRILRSIEGLQKAGSHLIRAFNMEFRVKPTIQVNIQSLQHFTVVLGVCGGVNREFLDQFDFGC